MIAADATYRPLKAFVAHRGGVRIRLHGELSDKIVEAIVVDWPVSCQPDRLEEVVLARLKVRLRRNRSRIAAAFLMAAVGSQIARLAVDWYFERQSHRVLMVGWATQAQKRG